MLVEFEVFCDLTDVDGSVYGVVGVLHQIDSGGDPFKKRVVDTSQRGARAIRGMTIEDLKSMVELMNLGGCMKGVERDERMF